MFTEKYCDEYYMSLIKLNPTYVWGANMSKATPVLMNQLLQAYGNPQQYNSNY